MLILFAALWFVPLAWAVATALKPEAETTDVPVEWIASRVTLDAFQSVLSAGNLPRWYFNSALTSLAITAITVLLASLAAFGFSAPASAAATCSSGSSWPGSWCRARS